MLFFQKENLNYIRKTMKLLQYIAAIIFLLNTNVNYCDYSYKSEFKNFKSSEEYNLAFNKDANSTLKKIRQDIENYTHLNIFQRFLLSTFLSTSSIIVTQKTMPKLFQYIDDICKKEKISTPAIFIDTSEGIFNAFAQKLFISSGGILIGQKLLNEITDEELEAVIAHEIGHIRHNHTNKLILTNGLTLGTSFLICQPIKIERCPNGKIKNINVNILPTLLLNVLLYSLIVNKKYEREADRFACRYGKQRGLIKFFNRLEGKKNKMDSDFNNMSKLLKENKDNLNLMNYTTFNLEFYLALAKHKVGRLYDWIYHNTPLGAHPSNKARIEETKKSLLLSE
jgi:Zn-dependent protease with chaperone function